MFTRLRWLGLAYVCSLGSSGALGQSLGLFEGRSDVGLNVIAGTATFDQETRVYRLSGSGENIWARVDAFSYAWRKVSGDLELVTNVRWEGGGTNAHRKAGWMVRQDLSADAPYADAVVHGDGLISLQYRRVRCGATMEVRSSVQGPALLKLERHGNQFTMSVAPDGKASETAGSVTVEMTDPVYAGLVVCSHEAKVSETAEFRDVSLSNKLLNPGVKRLRESTLEPVSIETGRRQVVYQAREHFEAPNWSRDGAKLVVNRQGRMCWVLATGGTLKEIDTGTLAKCNNDHGFSPDGKWLAISDQSGAKRVSLISVLPSEGGRPRQVTSQGPSYWHGWSPDGHTLAYCAQREGEFDIYTIPVAGGEETRLTTAKGLDDGPDYAPDGKRIYFNSDRTGLMKIWRMNADGTEQEQVTTDTEHADWFPHPSPDGQWLLYLSYDASVSGHPADQDVVLQLVPLKGGEPRVLATLFGGQGTINVPSWSPDSSEVAFVSYRMVIP